jgi:hypothetical protein
MAGSNSRWVNIKKGMTTYPRIDVKSQKKKKPITPEERSFCLWN